jgi:hypothetical protein
MNLVYWGIGVALQVFFVVHAVRTGRTMWIFIIVFLPVVGPAVYFVAEFLPDLRGTPVGRSLGSSIARSLDGGRPLRRLKEQLDIADTFSNRIGLADAYLRAGQPDSAIPLYERCLSGEYADDPVALGGLCKAHFVKADYTRALELLRRLATVKQSRPTLEFDLLYARTLEELGRTQEALEAFETLLPVITGEETRVRYGMLLAKMDRRAEAHHVFEETLRNARLSPPYYRRSEREWIRAAKAGLRQS